LSRDALFADSVALVLEGLAIAGTGDGESPLMGKAILRRDSEVGRFPKHTHTDGIPDKALAVGGDSKVSPRPVPGDLCGARLRQALHQAVGAADSGPVRHGDADPGFAPSETLAGYPSGEERSVC